MYIPISDSLGADVDEQVLTAAEVFVLRANYTATLQDVISSVLATGAFMAGLA